ncbi:MAG: hypothetical protein LW817_05965 [Candidatus Caenarcaniphilales bacterium]|jgi:hypothetical protein|nr:hypothetical protein [Candidatus Caenarcaniphilales bacterium]
MDLNTKLKSLALILRSLPPNTQKSVFEQLPLPLVQRISDVDLSIEETLSQEDWDYFARSWPEFFRIIESVRNESKVKKSSQYLYSERPKVCEYIEYRLGKRKIRPNFSHAIAKIIDEIAFESSV